MKYRISANVIRRLPRYLRRLSLMDRQGIEKTSSGDLGARMGLTASQIRQDFNCFGNFGQQGYGYNVKQLRADVGSVLGLERTLTAVVIGVGNLGRALCSNFRFGECGFQVTAAFDVDPTLVGTEVGGIRVLDAQELPAYLRDRPTDAVVLTLPQKYARDAAVLAARSGVRGIWNFTGVDIDADLGDSILENVHLSDSLLTLGYYLRNQNENENETENEAG